MRVKGRTYSRVLSGQVTSTLVARPLGRLNDVEKIALREVTILPSASHAEMVTVGDSAGARRRSMVGFGVIRRTLAVAFCSTVIWPPGIWRGSMLGLVKSRVMVCSRST